MRRLERRGEAEGKGNEKKGEAGLRTGVLTGERLSHRTADWSKPDKPNEEMQSKKRRGVLVTLEEGGKEKGSKKWEGRKRQRQKYLLYTYCMNAVCDVDYIIPHIISFD